MTQEKVTNMMAKVKVLANRALIAIDALSHGVIHGGRAESKALKKGTRAPGDGADASRGVTDVPKRVFIVFQGIFGDAVALQSVLDEFTRMFPRSQGAKVTLLVRASVAAFMRDVLPLPDELIIEEVDFKRFLVDYGYYRETVKKYRDAADLLVIPLCSLSGQVFAAASNARRKVGLIGVCDTVWPPSMAAFYRIAYTERVRPQMGETMLTQLGRLVRYIGDDGYQVRLQRILRKPPIVSEKAYCVLCPGASVTMRRWPADRFAAVADYIIEKYEMPVHLCGGEDEAEFGDDILKHAKCAAQIVNHIGKTDFSGWSSLIQKAELVVGNDSAGVHLAVGGRTPSICIAGAYSKYGFFPYQVDVSEPGDVIPVTLSRDMPCEYCRARGYYAGYHNRRCKKRIRRGECVTCIDAIGKDEVLVEIDKFMAGGHKGDAFIKPN